MKTFILALLALAGLTFAASALHDKRSYKTPEENAARAASEEKRAELDAVKRELPDGKKAVDLEKRVFNFYAVKEGQSSDEEGVDLEKRVFNFYAVKDGLPSDEEGVDLEKRVIKVEPEPKEESQSEDDAALEKRAELYSEQAAKLDSVEDVNLEDDLEKRTSG